MTTCRMRTIAWTLACLASSLAGATRCWPTRHAAPAVTTNRVILMSGKVRMPLFTSHVRDQIEEKHDVLRSTLELAFKALIQK